MDPRPFSPAAAPAPSNASGSQLRPSPGRGRGRSLPKAGGSERPAVPARSGPWTGSEPVRRLRQRRHRDHRRPGGPGRSLATNALTRPLLRSSRTAGPCILAAGQNARQVRICASGRAPAQGAGRAGPRPSHTPRDDAPSSLRNPKRDKQSPPPPAPCALLTRDLGKAGGGKGAETQQTWRQRLRR